MPFLADIAETSPYLGRLMAARPELAAEVKAALDAAERDRALPAAETEGAADGS